MSYQINTENTGLDTDEQVIKMAELMQSFGYDVESTRDFGLINRSENCPVPDRVWQGFLEQAVYETTPN